MGQANSSTVYSSLPNTANDFILSPLDDSDDDEEELFSSTNDQHDEDLFLTSRYLHRSFVPCRLIFCMNTFHDICRPSSDEGWGTTLVQIGLPFLVAGLGMVAAGLVLARGGRGAARRLLQPRQPHRRGADAEAGRGPRLRRGASRPHAQHPRGGGTEARVLAWKLLGKFGRSFMV